MHVCPVRESFLGEADVLALSADVLADLVLWLHSMILCGKANSVQNQ